MDFTITLDAQIAAAKRELALRENLYPKWIAANRLKRDVAEQGMASMRAILHTLVDLKAQAELNMEGYSVPVELTSISAPRREQGLLER